MWGVVSSLGVAGREGLCPFNFIIVNSVFSLLSIDVRTKIIRSKKKKKFENHPVSDQNPQEAGREPRLITLSTIITFKHDYE